MFQEIPEEIKEKCFGFLDGRSLARARAVCKTWKNVIENLNRVTDLWKKCCIREIDGEIITELCGNIAFNTFVSDSSLPSFSTDWNKLYSDWYSTSKIGDWPSKPTQFSAFDSIPITCCKLSGHWILTGHRNGSVCAWDATTGKIMRVVSQHLKMVTDIAPVDILNEGPYGPPENFSAHHHVVSVSKDHNIQVCSLIPKDRDDVPSKYIIHHHSDNLESVRVFGKCFAVSCMDNSVTVWTMSTPIHSSAAMEINLRFILNGPNDILRWIGFWNDRILCLCHNAVLKVFALDVEDWAYTHRPLLSSSPRLLVPSSTCDFEDYTIILTNAFLFREKTVFMLTVDRQLWVSTDGHRYCQYHTMETLQSYVVCVALRGNLLALGMERGMVLAFHLPNRDSLLHLNMKQPQWSQQLSEASIISIDIGCDNNSPVIVATTSETVFVIKWPIPS